jgi:class 3 adenylate cyclase
MVTCPNCGQENPDGFRLCGMCGAPLQEAPPPHEERKIVTVLFCDLVGSTAQAERMDPEDVRALLSRYHEHVRAELERFGVTVEKFIGDAVMALFGAPVAPRTPGWWRAPPACARVLPLRRRDALHRRGRGAALRTGREAHVCQ